MSDTEGHCRICSHKIDNKELSLCWVCEQQVNIIAKGVIQELSAKDAELSALKGEVEQLKARSDIMRSAAEYDDKLTQGAFDKLKGEVERLTKAVEFAQYMKTDAEELLLAQEHLNIMCGEDGQDHDSDDICDAEQTVADHTRSLRASIYEFTKRIPLKAEEGGKG